MPRHQSDPSSAVTADVVLLVDTNSNMRPCLAALKRSMGAFIGSLTSPRAYGHVLITDWRIRVTSYDRRDDPNNECLSNSLFVSDMAQANAQVQAIEATDDSSAPRPLLEALEAASHWPATAQDQHSLPHAWRHFHDARRTVIVVTNGICGTAYRTPDGRLGSIEDVCASCLAMRIRLCLFAPEAPCYEKLEETDRCEYHSCGSLDIATNSLIQFFSQPGNLQTFMRRKVMQLRAMRSG